MSYAFCKRFPPELAEEIFEHILNKALNNRVIDPKEVFIDGTHIKASANNMNANLHMKHIQRATDTVLYSA